MIVIGIDAVINEYTNAFVLPGKRRKRRGPSSQGDARSQARERSTQRAHRFGRDRVNAILIKSGPRAVGVI